MRIAFLTILLIATGAQAQVFKAQNCASLTSSFVATLPCDKELLDMIEREDGCSHFASEEPYDEERRAFLIQQLDELKCETLGADKEALVHTYTERKDVGALQVLREYEEHANGPLKPESGTPRVRDARHIIQEPR